MTDSRTGTEEMTPPQGEGTETFLRCPICSTPNDPALRYCSGCRGPLGAATVITADEAAAIVRQHERRRKLRRWRVPVIAAACVLVAAVVVYIRLQPPGPLPRPASNVSASSPPGQFTQAGYDGNNSNYVPEAPEFTGEVRWSFQTAEPFTASPAVTADTVYAGTGDRRIIALDAATGALRWEFPTGGPVDSTPAIAGDWLFTGLRDGRVISLDRKTGALRWAHDTGAAVGVATIVVDGEVYAANASGVLTVLDAATGKFRWRTDEERAEGPVTRSGDVVITTSGTKYYLWDAKNGANIHYYATAASITTPVTVGGHLSYVGDLNGGVWVADITYRPEWYTKGPGRRLLGQLYVWGMAPRPPNGTVWARRLSREILYPFAVDERFVYVPAASGTVTALDIATHQVAWSAKVGQGPAAGAVRAGSTLFVPAGNGLNALDPATGKVLWTAAVAAIPTVPAVTSHGIYVTAGNGVLYALK